MIRNDTFSAARRYVGEVGALRAYEASARSNTSFWRAVRSVCEDGFRRAAALDKIEAKYGK